MKVDDHVLRFGEGRENAQPRGADTVIRQHREATESVEVPDAGILLDVDDPETFQRLDSV